MSAPLPPIDVETYADSDPVELEETDLTFLTTQLPKTVRVYREATSGLFVVNPKQYAGLAALPSGRMLRSRPRIRTNNLFLMLGYSEQIPKVSLDPTLELDSLEELLEFVASYFADRVEDQIEQGLYRAYVETEDNLPVVRGRIQVADDIRENFVLRHRVYCRFTEFTWDVLENQILRYALHLLSGWPFKDDLLARLHQLDRRMDEVSLTPVSVDTIDRVQYTRLTSSYEPLHRLARLFIEQVSLAEEEGPTEFSSFFIDMNVLFEVFVAKMLEAFAPKGLRVIPQRHLYLGHRHAGDRVFKSGRIIPDLQVETRSGVAAVLDTKFKRSGPIWINNPDFYQALAYCTALATPLGALIYPRTELDEPDDLFIQNSDIRIRRFVIDLNVPAAELRAEAETLASAVWSWTREIGQLQEVAALAAN